MAIEVGTAYISILPTTDKLSAGIKSALKDVETEADKTGKEAGKKMGGGFKSGLKKALVGVAAIGAGATVGAGSTVTKEVEADQLAVARGKQRNIDGWQRPVKQ